MGNALMRTSGGGGSGVLPAVASAVVPGLGQLINGESDKALGVFVVSAVAGASLVRWIPLVGRLAYVIGAVTWVYGVADAYFTGKKK